MHKENPYVRGCFPCCLKGYYEEISEEDLRASSIKQGSLYSLHFLSGIPSLILDHGAYLYAAGFGIGVGALAGSIVSVMKEKWCKHPTCREEWTAWAQSLAAKKPAIQFLHGALNVSVSVGNVAATIFWNPHFMALNNGFTAGFTGGYNGIRFIAEKASELSQHRAVTL